MNEPQCFIMNGYMQGAHAPFQHKYLALSKLTRICMRAFAESVRIIRANAKTPPKIGIAMAAGAYIPASESEEAIEEARHKTFYAGLGTMDTSRSDLVQAVLEGVAFAIRDSFEIARGLGIEIPRSNICGGAAKSRLWQKILANVLNIPLDSVLTEQGPGYGGAILAMVGCGEYESVRQATDKLVSVASTVYPDREIAARYETKYQNFKKIYPTLKPLFQMLKEE